LTEFYGKPAIWWLVKRLMESDYPVCLAIPSSHEDDPLIDATKDLKPLVFRGHDTNPLGRFFWASMEYGFDPVVRVTHDDLFVDTVLMGLILRHHEEGKLDYTYMSDVLRGTDSEVVSKDFLTRAYEYHKDRDVEYLSYAFRRQELKAKIKAVSFHSSSDIKGRISLDWPEDILTIKKLFDVCEGDMSDRNIYEKLILYPEILSMNHLPKVTVYTCAHNAEKTIERTIKSVLNQTYKDFEYILYDDGSTDNTFIQIGSCTVDRRVELMGGKNEGLGSACNRALKNAKGKYYIRVDADDELLPHALQMLVDVIKKDNNLCVIYPSYRNQHGEVFDNYSHHMGGAMVRAWMFHELKFCDGLRAWEGLEFFNRMSKRYKYQELNIPTWIYYQTETSLSKTQPDYRDFVYKVI